MKKGEPSFTLRPLGDALGMEVIGVDLNQPLSADDSLAMSKALDDHTVLLFRDQDVSEAAQIGLARIFGEPSLRSRPADIVAEENEYSRAIGLVTNIRKNGKPIGSLPDGEMWFHHDGCFIDEPYRATMLYAVHVPSQGGHTRILNMYEAYELLPAETKRRLQGRTCLHIFDYKTLTNAPDPDQDLSAVRYARHPAVVRHPNNGKSALYINPLLTARIEGLSRQESDELIRDVCRFTENDSLVYEHVWSPRDLIVWDNWGSCHARTDFPHDQIRMLRRSIVKGQALAAASVN
jgi:taurine dioxygenase